MIGQTYDAALGQEDWAAALERLSGVLGGDSSVVLQRSARPGSRGERSGCRADPDYVPLFDRYYRDLCPILPMLGGLPSGSVFVDFMMIPEATLMRTEYRTDYALPQDRYSSLYWTAPMATTPRRSDRVAVAAPAGLGHGAGPAAAASRPHLSRALSIERRLADTAATPEGGRLSPRERTAWPGRPRPIQQADRPPAGPVGYTVDDMWRRHAQAGRGQRGCGSGG